MAFNEALATRIRSMMGRRRGIVEKRMFGGLTFMQNGKMFIGVVGDEILVRIGKDAHDEVVARKHVRVMDHGGRPAIGYVYVRGEAVATDAALREWIDRATAHVATLAAPARGRAA